MPRRPSCDARTRYHEAHPPLVAAKEIEGDAVLKNIGDSRCITQTIKLPPPILTDEMCEAFTEALGKHLDVITEDDGKPYDRVYLQAVWDDIWRTYSAPLAKENKNEFKS